MIVPRRLLIRLSIYLLVTTNYEEIIILLATIQSPPNTHVYRIILSSFQTISHLFLN